MQRSGIHKTAIIFDNPHASVDEKKKATHDLTSKLSCRINFNYHLKQEKKMEFIIPDLHGNIYKLISILEDQGLLKFASLQDKNTLINIYTKNIDAFTRDDLIQFKNILNRCQIEPHVFLRFIGDNIGDRGNNDVLMLIFMNWLSKKGMEYEVILSNHDLDALDVFSQVGLLDEKEKPHEEKLKEEEIHFGMPKHQQRSLRHFIKLYNNGVITHKHAHRLILNYFKHLQIFSYIIEEGTPTKLYFLSHAPAGCEGLIGLVTMLGLKYNVKKEKNIKCFAEQIDVIKKTFREKLNEKDGYKWLAQQSRYNSSSILTPIIYFAWNRKKDKICGPKSDFKFCNIHGHMGVSSEFPFQWEKGKKWKMTGINLDYHNNLGRDDSLYGMPPGGSGPLSIYVVAPTPEDYKIYLEATDRQQHLKEESYHLASVKKEMIELMEALKRGRSKKSKRLEKFNECIKLLEQKSNVTDVSDLKEKYEFIFHLIIEISLFHNKKLTYFFEERTKTGKDLLALLNSSKDFIHIKKIFLNIGASENIEYHDLRKKVIPPGKDIKKFFHYRKANILKIEHKLTELSKKEEVLLVHSQKRSCPG